MLLIKVFRSEPLGVWIFVIVRKSKCLENTTLRKLDLFPHSCGESVNLVLLGLAERTNTIHWNTWISVFRILGSGQSAETQRSSVLYIIVVCTFIFG